MECPIRYETCPICSGTAALWREKDTKHGRFAIDIYGQAQREAQSLTEERVSLVSS